MLPTEFPTKQKNVSTSLPTTISLRRVGWKNKDKVTDGLKFKELITLDPLSDESDSIVQSMIEFASKGFDSCVASMMAAKQCSKIVAPVNGDGEKMKDKNDDNNIDDDDDAPQQKKEISNDHLSALHNISKGAPVYIRRLHFPILPCDDPSSISIRKLEDSTCLLPSQATSPATAQSAKIISVTILDEPTPEIHQRKATVDCENQIGITLPPGARTVGDRVILPNGMVISSAKYRSEQNDLIPEVWASSAPAVVPDFGWTTAGDLNGWTEATWGDGAKMPKKQAASSKKMRVKKTPDAACEDFQWNAQPDDADGGW